MNDLTLIPTGVYWRHSVPAAKNADRRERYRVRQLHAHNTDPTLKLLTRVHDGLLIQRELRSGPSEYARLLFTLSFAWAFSR